VARITGKLAALFLGGPLARVGDLFDWTFETPSEILDCSIKGDFFTRVVPSHNTSRITAQRYVNTSAIMTKEVYDCVTLGEQLAFRLDLIAADNTFSQISGTGYFARATLTAPRGMIVDGFEIAVDGEWTITLPGSA